VDFQDFKNEDLLIIRPWCCCLCIECDWVQIGIMPWCEKAARRHGIWKAKSFIRADEVTPFMSRTLSFYDVGGYFFLWSEVKNIFIERYLKKKAHMMLAFLLCIRIVCVFRFFFSGFDAFFCIKGNGEPCTYDERLRQVWWYHNVCRSKPSI